MKQLWEHESIVRNIGCAKQLYLSFSDAFGKTDFILFEILLCKYTFYPYYIL